GGAALQGVRIRNNQFTAPNRSSYNGFINVSGAKDVIIEDNLFSGIGHDADKEIVSCGIALNQGEKVTVKGNRFRFWPGAGVARVAEGIRLEAAVRGAAVTENEFAGSGHDHCFGIRVSDQADGSQGTLRGNRFRKARLEAGRVPSEANRVE
ncbi:MAG: right-handed parallel beta-helix repeat-containing protein, partial [Actinomycetota bacterium]